MGYTATPFTVKQTEEFVAWLDGIKNGMTRRRLQTRVRKLSLGLWGDVQPVGDGVSELREDFGPGWRMYCIQRGPIVVMLGGGTKRTQEADIAQAKTLAATFED